MKKNAEIFFSESIAPFTTSSTSVTEVASSNSDEKLVQSFMRDLINYMQSIKATQKYQFYISNGIIDTFIKIGHIVLFLNNAGNVNCGCGHPNPFPSGAVWVSEAVALLNSHNIPSEESDCERVKYSSYEIEHTIHHMGKKCKQQFLKADHIKGNLSMGMVETSHH